MNIISHRGFWCIPNEKNTESAFIRSWEKGFGLETDIRDFNGELVISHDLPKVDSLKLNVFFELYKRKSNLTLALNIKSDGLQSKLIEQLNHYGITDYFVFDMSVPDTLGYIEKGFNFFSRHSEHESAPVFYDRCSGIWLDSFTYDWFDKKTLNEHLDNSKKISIVSPELHGRNPSNLWSFLKDNDFHLNSGIMLCTDFPQAAKDFFSL